jgi:hypothetical protein
MILNEIENFEKDTAVQSMNSSAISGRQFTYRTLEISPGSDKLNKSSSKL